ncbi:helix-turn-helix domain-containing protein [Streptomyces filamentosus NRRL 15998]|uniref:Helix-turn-helix domain-containing protein n=1 Tax=Streptomyces filamentosus NRRL 15998 TaxID=457431 RepID=D6AC21_STRFL|nr:helix-turn-helix domain-containing protein [Streptomyces filamentosus NRRL 15998]
MDQEHAAEAVACSTAKISRIESGTVSARVGDVRMLLDLYEVEDVDERRLLEKLARDSNKRGWWMDFDAGQPVREILGDFLSLESDATYIRTWQPVLIPGFLQTPEYTRALTDAGPDVISEEAADMVVKVRQERRRVFEEAGARFAAVIWEPAITGPMPSPAVHRAQLAHLNRMAKQPNMTIQVLPHTEWAAARVSPAFVGLSYGQGGGSGEASAGCHGVQEVQRLPGRAAGVRRGRPHRRRRPGRPRQQGPGCRAPVLRPRPLGRVHRRGEGRHFRWLRVWSPRNELHLPAACCIGRVGRVRHAERPGLAAGATGGLSSLDAARVPAGRLADRFRRLGTFAARAAIPVP